MLKILIAAGHGAGTAHNRGALYFNEGDNNYLYSLELKKALEAYKDVKVDLLRKKIEDNPSLAQRSAMGEGYDLYWSVHSNAADSLVRGTEVWDSVENPNKALAKSICDATAKLFNHNNRGVKYKEGQPGYNWYGELRLNGAKSSMIVESGFHTNSQDCSFFKSNHKELATVQATATAEHYNLIKQATSETAIISSPDTTVEQMKVWAKNKGANQVFVDLAPLFYDISTKAGISPALTYTQSAKETGYMKFGGVLDITYNNPCGLKVSSGGGDKDPNAHQVFTSWNEGVQAQVDHLCLYAGANGYPKANTPDPRHFPYLKGTATTIESLGGKWAPNLSYGKDILKMMEELKNTATPGTPQEPNHWAESSYKYLTEEKGIKINERRFSDNATRGEMFAILARALGFK